MNSEKTNAAWPKSRPSAKQKCLKISNMLRTTAKISGVAAIIRIFDEILCARGPLRGRQDPEPTHSVERNIERARYQL